MNKILLIVVALASCTAFPEITEGGTISGRVMISNSVPMAKGVLYVFSDATGPPPSFDFRYWRVPDEMARIDSEGRFTTVLPDGRYYLGAIQRRSGDDIGPLQEGDLFLPLPGQGGFRYYTVDNGSTLDVGTITGAMPFRKEMLNATDAVTAIEGTVIDSRREPVENALVFAFVTPAMVGKPLYISEKTGKDGKFFLRVHAGGSFYLKIRSSYGGGAIKAGEIAGTYGKDNPVAVEVKTGAVVKGITIQGSRFRGAGAVETAGPPPSGSPGVPGASTFGRR